MSTAPKSLLTEAVMFFSERGVCKEVLYTEFEALLDGLVATPEFADETIEAVFLQINNRLQVRAAVFFTMDFDMDGYVNRLWNMPLRQLAEKAGRGPDMGGGPIRLACLGFTTSPEYRENMWKPGQRNGRADLALIKEAVNRNALGIIGDDEEAYTPIPAERLRVAAEDAWYDDSRGISESETEPRGESASQPVAAAQTIEDQAQRERDEHLNKIALYTRQILTLQERLKQAENRRLADLDQLRQDHTDHLNLIRGEMIDIKNELASQQKINASLRRELAKAQNRTSID
ncbi:MULTISPECIES: hypothetical protein [Pseudomonas]|uniref:hypothetical protein n=1 Tax=Pseudomonas TaxID=286 RepID=UPI00123A8365|nr:MULTISPECIES: hypothetical protein [Pseudomonas]QIB52549.1 hypothetical protein G3M63_16765 [Pseudomonas sp. OIL-1]